MEFFIMSEPIKKEQLPFWKDPFKKIRAAWSRWVAFGRMMKKFLPFIRKQRKRLILAQLSGMFYILLHMLEPWPLKLIFDCVFLDKELPSFLAPLFQNLSDESPILFLNLLIASIILIAIIQGIFYFYQQLLTSMAGQQIISNVRLALFSHLQYLSFTFHDRRRTGDLLSRFTTDIRIQRDILISMPVDGSTKFLLALGIFIVLFVMDADLALLALVALPVLGMLLKKYQSPMRQTIRERREREGQLSNVIADVLGAMKVVQGFTREEDEISRFQSENKGSLRKGLKAARLEAKFRWASELAIAVATATVVYVAARRVLSGALSPGDLIVFMAYLRTFYQPLRRVSKTSERMARVTASGERIMDLLKVEPTVTDLPGAIVARGVVGDIRYENVTFSYPKGGRVLKNINLHIRPKERLGIVGSTGSGKSSLISLLPRFYDVQEGMVLLDGKDVRQYTLASLRQNISLVFQEPFLFPTSIIENIGYGKPEATNDEIVIAAKKAGIHEIIEALPEGYETELGEQGGTLSGGQRQCIAIARAMIKDAPIVILDEPTTGLDDLSAELVMRALKRLMEDKTVIVITHQLENVRNMDRIVVLRDGKLHQEGTPAEILTNDLYQSEVKSSLGVRE
jgi:ATP-binding cassette subfamily B protein